MVQFEENHARLNIRLGESQYQKFSESIKGKSYYKMKITYLGPTCSALKGEGNA